MKNTLPAMFIGQREEECSPVFSKCRSVESVVILLSFLLFEVFSSLFKLILTVQQAL